ncbi:hypothetical protein [Halofilum ochraceum]|uniref:hypothetical protein n=1 Tax=Halofilum ochraceum TaxID=1611323 RepID=UPI0008D9EEEC|nr:hypothetical protein [Halofilum ochraceum]
MSGDRPPRSETEALADRVRSACIERLRHDYEQAAIQGLCGEGAFEYALDRLRHLPTDQLLAAAPPACDPPTDQGTDP